VLPAVETGTSEGVQVRRKVSTTVYLNPEQADALAAYSLRTGVPSALVVREGVEMSLRARGVTIEYHTRRYDKGVIGPTVKRRG
jgi:hypothetical protein